jgi:hypothetical protein
MTPRPEMIPFYLAPGPLESVKLRFPAEYADEIQALLDEHNIEHSVAAEFSSGVSLAIESVELGAQALGALGGLSGLAVALGHVYKTFAHRHDGKQVTIDELGAIDVRGFSQKETEHFIERQLKEQAERDAAWRWSTGQAPENVDDNQPQRRDEN